MNICKEKMYSTSTYYLEFSLKSSIFPILADAFSYMYQSDHGKIGLNEIVVPLVSLQQTALNLNIYFTYI